MATPRVPLPPEPVPAPCAAGGDISCFREELGPTAGRALVTLARAVDAWVHHGPRARADVDPECIPELSLTVQALVRLTADPAHDAATAEAIGFGCYNVAEWAEEKGAVRSALAWAQLAIAAWPQQPQYAYLIGRLARRSAAHEHAERWLRYAMRLSRRRMEWETYALALGGFANLKRQRGNLPYAVRYHRLSLKIAQRHNLRTVEGDALYDLAVVAMDIGDVDGAMGYGRQALRAYGPGHGRVHRLAHDFAWLLMVQRGDFFHAACVFHALKPFIWDPPYRLILLASLCRASAAAGWESVFEEAWVDAWVLIRTGNNRESHSSALIQLAYGAATAGSAERARMAAERGLAVARERAEGMELLLAENILHALQPGTESSTYFAAFPDQTWLQADERQPVATAAHFVEDLVGILKTRRDEASGLAPRAYEP